MVITKLSVPVLLACSLLGAAATGGATFAAVTARVDAGAQKAAETAGQVEKLREQTAEDHARLKGIETDIRYIGASLQRIEGRLGTK